MPDDVAEEKVKALKALGADVERVRPTSIVDKKQVHSSLLHLRKCCADVSLFRYAVCGTWFCTIFSRTTVQPVP